MPPRRMFQRIRGSVLKLQARWCAQSEMTLRYNLGIPIVPSMEYWWHFVLLGAAASNSQLSGVSMENQVEKNMENDMGTGFT